MTADNHEPQWGFYLAAYGAVEPDERQRLLEQAVADDVVFTNPGGEGKTRQGLIRHIEGFRQKMAGAYFKTDQLFRHHGELLAVWSMYKADHTKVATGYNFVQSDESGRFRYMAGFF